MMGSIYAESTSVRNAVIFADKQTRSSAIAVIADRTACSSTIG